MLLALLVVLGLLSVALMAWPLVAPLVARRPVDDAPREFRTCGDCATELAKHGGVIFVRAKGEPMREMAWGAVCDAHPSDRAAQATNFVTVASTVVHAMTAPRRGPLAPVRRIVRSVRTWAWWRKVVKQSNGGEATW